MPFCVVICFGENREKKRREQGGEKNKHTKEGGAKKQKETMFTEKGTVRDSLVEMNRREKANREWIRSPHTKEYLKKFRDEVVCSSTRKSEGFSRENFSF